MSKLVKGWLTFLLVLLAAYGSFSLWRVSRSFSGAITAERLHATGSDAIPAGAESTPVGAQSQRPLSDFTFTERSGKPFNLVHLEGKLWVANTFFASCPGFCLQMNREVAAMAADLADADVTFVSFTVDPEADTPAKLREYANEFKADPKKWLFLRGDEPDLRGLVKGRLKLPASKEHSEKLVLVGRDGTVLSWYRYNDPIHVDKLKAKIRELAAETTPAADNEAP